MFDTLKIWLWKLSLWPEFKCPVCNGQLTEHGHDPNVVFTCNDKKCGFNKNG